MSGSLRRSVVRSSIASALFCSYRKQTKLCTRRPERRIVTQSPRAASELTFPEQSADRTHKAKSGQARTYIDFGHKVHFESPHSPRPSRTNHTESYLNCR